MSTETPNCEKAQTPPSPEQIDDWVHQERFEQAIKALQATDDAPITDRRARWRLALRRGWSRLVGEEGADDAILQLSDVVASADAVTEELPRAHAVLIRALTAKRCQPLAEKAVAEARSTLGEAPPLLVAEGKSALTFDDRPRARACFERALTLAPDWGRARLVRAELAYVLGDFSGCFELLRGISPEDDARPAALRLEAAAAAASKDNAAEIDAWRQVLQRVPHSDRHAVDRINLALALAAADQRKEAEVELEQTWRADPESPEGNFARDRLEFLQVAAPELTAKRLQEFPTTQQKWNYCGPAVLELCLRFLGIELGQDEIAQVVKRSGGTPMYEIAHYLEKMGVAARRVEATPERLRAAIDLGLPVIVQEEYSTTTHVAVVSGYDPCLGMFIVSDPMTHRRQLRTYGWTERAGSLFGNGGLLVLGRKGPALAPLESRADQVGLMEARHLTLLDDCDRRRPGLAEGQLEDASLEQEISLCQKALELSPAFKLAHHRLWNAEAARYRHTGSQGLRQQVLRRLFSVRTRFADDEWPHQLHGAWLMGAGLYEEAYLAYFEASRRDPDDADNRQMMGEAKWLAGDLAAAESHLQRALALEPFHRRATETMAAVLLRQLQEDWEAEDEDGDLIAAQKQPLLRLCTTAPDTITVALKRQDEDLDRRAIHFSRMAVNMAPDNPFNHEVAGAVALLGGDWERAQDCYQEALRLDPERLASVYGLAHARLQRGEAPEKITPQLQEGCSRFYRDPDVWLAAGSHLARCGSVEQAAELLEQGVGAVPQGSGPPRLLRRYFSLWRDHGSTETAAAKLRGLVERRLQDVDLVRVAAAILDDADQRGHAIALWRRLVQVAPNDVEALFRLGDLLSKSITTRDEGRTLLERASELAPRVDILKRELALLGCEEDPDAALALLEGTDPTDPFLLETRAAALALAGRAQDSERVLAQALGCFADDLEGVEVLADWHLDEDRYARALDLVRWLTKQNPVAQLSAGLQQTWLRTHRLNGTVAEVLDDLRALLSEGVPRHLAFGAYWGCSSLAPELAARAASSLAERKKDPEQQLEWRIRAAGQQAVLGDLEPLRALRRTTQSAEALADLYHELMDVEAFDEADACAQEAIARAPDSFEAVTAIQGMLCRQGQVEEAIAAAEKMMALRPFEHHGAEKMAIVQAKLLHVKEALDYSARALDAAPYCHNAHMSRALALFVAGRHEQALASAVQALRISGEDEQKDSIEEAVVLLRALRHDAAGLERCLAKVHQSQPEQAYADYKALLRRVAAGR